jgi:ABC-2 type transport system ATP-binding protein
LSTHIVEDVATLCSRFALLKRGRIVANTTPGEAKRALEGRLFEGSVSRDAARELADRHALTQAVLVEGRDRVRVYEASGTPPLGFTAVEPTLEDAYFVLMRGAA